MTAPDRKRLAAAAVFATFLVLCIAAGTLAARLQPGGVQALLGRFLAFEHAHGEASWLLAFAIQLLAALCGVLPASIPAIAAGLLYGVPQGFALAACAVLLGAILAFGASRSVFRPWVVAAIARSPRAQRLDAAVTREGWRLVCLLRISPVMPFALTSYALGLTSLAPRTYMLGTLMSLPPLLGYVALGRLARGGLATFLAGGPATGAGRALDAALLGVGVAGTVLLILLFGRMARSALSNDPRRELQT